MKRPRTLLSIGVLWMGLCASAWSTVTASVDHKQLSPGDTVQLTVQSDGNGSAEPDLSPLASDFDILGRSSGSSLQITNGHSVSQRQIVLVLSPKRSGQIDVPPLLWNGEQSAPISLTVSASGPGNNAATGAASASANAASHVFITTQVDTPKPYVQAAVKVTLKVYSDQSLYQADLDLAGSGDVVVQHIGQDIQSEELRDGRRYHVVERSYILFPQRSGDIKLEGAVLNAQVADQQSGMDPFFERMLGQMQMQLPGRLMSSMRPLRLHGQPISLTVQARPADMRNGEWLPAREVKLDETWQPQDGNLSTGQPVTRHLRLTALGLSAGQLPDLSTLMALPPGLKAYPDQPKLNDAEQAGQLLGTRDQDIALMADRPGRYEVPALKISWWDTAAQQRRTVSLPARTLHITGPVINPAAPAPAITAPAATALPEAPAAQPPWFWISLGLGLLWLGTLVAWGVTRRRHAKKSPVDTASPPPESKTAQPVVSEAVARRQFHQACRANSPLAARAALLAWARASNSPEHPPAGLNALARQLADSTITGLIRELDRACLADTPWKGEALADALPSLGRLRVKPTSVKAALPSLYRD